MTRVRILQKKQGSDVLFDMLQQVFNKDWNRTHGFMDYVPVK